MADNKDIVIPQLPMKGGVDQTQHPARSDPGTFRSLQNMHIRRDQRMVIRGGSKSYFTTSSGAPMGIFNTSSILMIGAPTNVNAIDEYQYGAKRCMWTVINNQLHMLRNGNWSHNLNSNQLLTNKFVYTEFGEFIAFANTELNTALMVWDGGNSILRYGVNSPLSTVCSVHYDRLLTAGNPIEPDAWYASNVGNPDDWEPNITEEGDMDVGGFKGILPGRRTIVSISPSHYDGFYIGTKNSIHQIRGRAPSEYQHRLVSGGIGNIGHRTLISVGNDILGWNDNGCYSMIDTDRSGGVASSMVSRTVQDIFRTKVNRDPSKFFSINDTDNEMYITFMPSIESSSITYAMCLYYTMGQWVWWKFNYKILSACMYQHGHRPIMLLGDSWKCINYLVDGQLVDNDAITSYPIDVLIETQKIPIAVTPLNTGNLRHIDVHIHPTMIKTFTGKVLIDCNKNGLRSSNASIPISTNLAGYPAMTASGSTGFVLDSNDRLVADTAYDVVSLSAGGNGRSAQLIINDTALNIGELQLLGVQCRVNPSGSTP